MDNFSFNQVNQVSLYEVRFQIGANTPISRRIIQRSATFSSDRCMQYESLRASHRAVIPVLLDKERCIRLPLTAGVEERPYNV